MLVMRIPFAYLLEVFSKNTMSIRGKLAFCLVFDPISNASNENTVFCPTNPIKCPNGGTKDIKKNATQKVTFYMKDKIPKY